MNTIRTTGILSVFALLVTACTAPSGSDSASVTIQGSDTEVQLVSSIAEAFYKQNADVDISVTGGGSSVGIAALINGETDVANSSRQMKEKEQEQAVERGLNVQEYILAWDGLSVIVHPENPIESLSMDDVRRLYNGEVTGWSDVGGEESEVVLYGRQSTSGTFGFFRDTVVQADYANTMRQMEGNQAILDSVRVDKNGVGYVGVGYVRNVDDVKIVPIVVDGESVSPLDREAVLAGKYPIARRIYQYLAQPVEKDSALHRFLAFELTDEAQIIIEDVGFYPLTEQDKAHNRSLLGL